MTPARPPRVLVFIVAYHAETTILGVLERIPALEGYDVEVLMIDDGSTDGTFALSEKLRRLSTYRHKLTVLANPVTRSSATITRSSTGSISSFWSTATVSTPPRCCRR